MAYEVGRKDRPENVSLVKKWAGLQVKTPWFVAVQELWSQAATANLEPNIGIGHCIRCANGGGIRTQLMVISRFFFNWVQEIAYMETIIISCTAATSVEH